MAIASKGYDGTVSEVDWAGLAPGLGALESVVTGLGATVLSSPDRAVRIDSGVAIGHGVRDVSDTSVTVQCASVGSGTRWNTIALRRNWATNTTSVLVVAGTSTKMLAAGLQANPGVGDDQPLWLAKVQAGSSVVTELVDVRVYASKVLVVPDLLGLGDAPLGTHAVVGGQLWQRRLEAGSPVWWDGITRGAVSARPGWRLHSRAPGYTLDRRSGQVQFHGRIDRAALPFSVQPGRRYDCVAIPASIHPPQDVFFRCASTDASNVANVAYEAPTGHLSLAFAASKTYSSGFWVDLSGISWTL